MEDQEPEKLQPIERIELIDKIETSLWGLSDAKLRIIAEVLDL